MSTILSEKVTIKRALHDKQHPYVMISNAMFRDKSISPKSKGVLGYLLGLPSDWITHPLKLAEDLGIGRDQVYYVLKELIKAGYCKHTQKKEKGKFSEGVYEFSEFPEFKNKVPNTGSPDTVSPDTENPPLQKNEVLLDSERSEESPKTEKIKKNKQTKEKNVCSSASHCSLSPSEDMDKIYQYLKKKGYDDKVCARLSTCTTLQDFTNAVNYAKSQDLKNKSKGINIKNVKAYLIDVLKNRYWEDSSCT